MKKTSGPALHPHAFLTLDALRGIAAFAVIIFHTSEDFGYGFFDHAYMAVDFFFMLSGFVLSYAYQERLDKNLSRFAFMKARLIRLYPLYLAGTLAGFTFSLITFLHSGRATGMWSLFYMLSSAIAMLPAVPPPSYPGIAAFPYNIFAWTIFYELLANFFHATFLCRRSTRAILISAAIAFALLCGLVEHFGSDLFGLLTRDLPFGLARTAFSYLTGVLLFRIWQRHRHRFLISPLWSILIFGITISVPTPHHGSAITDIFLLLFVLPIIVLLGAFSQPSEAARPVASLLGTVSYAVYILSSPSISYLQRTWELVMKRPAYLFAPWPGITLIVFLFLAAWVADTVYDIPLRRWLTRRFADSTQSLSLSINSRPRWP